MNESILCHCGKPAHPLYGNLCEDCWVDNQGPGGLRFPTQGKFRSKGGEGIGGRIRIEYPWRITGRLE